MKCKQCEAELTGRQREFCSDKCRKRASRTKPGPEDAPQSTNADTVVVKHPTNADSLEPDSQSRTQDHSLPMTAGEVLASQTRYDVAAQELARPLKHVMYDDLYRRVCLYKGLDWKVSPEYKEIMHRLHTLTVEQLELEGQFVPGWKYSEEAA